MADEIQDERARRIRRERTRKEMEYELSRDLKVEEDKREINQIEQEHRNTFTDKAILFLTTFSLLYLLFYILHYLFNFFFAAAFAMLGVSVSFIYPFIHAAIWIAAIVSVYRGRSVLNDVADRFF